MSSFTSLIVKACLADNECRERVLKLIRSNRDTSGRAAAIRKLCVEHFRYRQNNLPKIQSVVLEEVLSGAHWGRVAEELVRHFSMTDSSVRTPPSRSTEIGKVNAIAEEKKSDSGPILL